MVPPRPPVDLRSRRRVLGSVVAAGVAGFAGCMSFAATDPEPLVDSVALETVVDGLEAPTDAIHPEAELLYVATQGGDVIVHGPDGVRDEPLLSLGDDVVVGTEQGLLGVALHPTFASNRRLFVRYSAPRRPGTPAEYSHTAVLAEFEVDPDGTRVLPDSERTVLEIPQPQDTHQAGDLAFGPDGALFVPSGDGGGHADADAGHAEDWYAENEGGNGQDVTENLLGSVLRIDVDADPVVSPRRDGAPTDDLREDAGYAIPIDNPLVGEAGHDEQWAWGFRNPWQLSFDGDDLYVADVGKWNYEEINLVERGGNYGWNVREGRHCFDQSDPSAVPASCPGETPDDVRGGEELRDPIVEYPHGGDGKRSLHGAAVIGGYLYRGTAFPEIEGRYVFGDYQPEGRLFVATPPRYGDDGDTGSDWSTDTIALTDEAADTLDRVLSFGRDPDGELYVLGGGGVHRLVPSG